MIGTFPRSTGGGCAGRFRSLFMTAPSQKTDLEGSAPSLPRWARHPGTDRAVPSSSDATSYPLSRRVRKLPHAAVRHPLQHIDAPLAVHAQRMRRGKLVLLAGLEFFLLHSLAVAEPGHAIVVLVENGHEPAEVRHIDMSRMLVEA